MIRFSVAKQRRRGYTLVFFAMILFGLMALAALVIDLGFARLSQQQMRAAANAAAVEGLRFRDDMSLPEDERDAARRQRASDVVAFIFDDDLLQTTTDNRNFGAGPRMELSGGLGDPTLNASQLITLPATPVYKPTRSDGTFGLEPNPGDLPHGDMVAGRYEYDPSIRPVEESNYSRSDFTPDSSDASAFLVRMRRTNDVQGLDNVAGVSSRGPSLPFLFARGALLGAQEINGYSPRRDGMTVRGTSIADARPVISIGLANDTQSLPGLTPLGLDLDFWNGLTTATDVTTTIAAGVIADPNGAGEGRCFPIGAAAAMPLVVGREIPTAQAIPDGVYSGYVPIYDRTQGERVLGFGEVEAVIAGGGTAITITRQPGRIATENASAVPVFAIPVSGDTWNTLLSRLDLVAEPLLAPASVR